LLLKHWHTIDYHGRIFPLRAGRYDSKRSKPCAS
jgi:hypothetical protein